MVSWLRQQSDQLDEHASLIGTRAETLRHQLSRHRDFQQQLAAKNILFDTLRREARRTRDRAPTADHAELDDMINELKQSWLLVCMKSLER
ncbi:unnamed protein product [Protopolystoma xenopodis]|uniref:Uncharacterized protein n=1 Tax=Protopolystoma xenopodis TaxID=117903 RepID=A0A448XQS7_9PLAT|nr:unnamed protein product [Protopolystoma xenopodis]